MRPRGQLDRLSARWATRPGKGKGKGKAKGHDKKLVRVRVVDERRAGVIVWVRVFDAVSGVLVSEEKA